MIPIEGNHMAGAEAEAETGNRMAAIEAGNNMEGEGV